MTEDKAEDVIDVLYGRVGFDHWWGKIDDDIKEEIKDEINEAIDNG